MREEEIENRQLPLWVRRFCPLFLAWHMPCTIGRYSLIKIVTIYLGFEG